MSQTATAAATAPTSPTATTAPTSPASSPLRITQLIERDFKRIESIDIAPGNRTLIMLQGPNENGKTSAIDGLIAALGGKTRAPEQPVRKGAEYASIEVTLGDDAAPRYRIKRTFSPDGSTYLTVHDLENPDRPAKIGAAQTMLDGLLADISFDPLEFIRADDKAQIGMLMAAAGLRERYDALQAQRRGVMENRRDLNRSVEEKKHRMAGMPAYQAGADERIDDVEVRAKLQEVEEHNRAIEDAAREVERIRIEAQDRKKQFAELKSNAERIIAENKEKIERLQSHIEYVNKEIVKNETETRAAMEALKASHAAAVEHFNSLGERKTADDVAAEIAKVNQHNAAYEANRNRKKAESEIESLAAQATAATQTIEQIDAEIVAAIEQSSIGQSVPGLKVVDGRILHNDVPITQASGMRRLELSALIGMASNARLRVMCIDEADKLDDESLARLVTLAKERGYQLWATAVRSGAESEDLMVVPVRGGMTGEAAK